MQYSLHAQAKNGEKRGTGTCRISGGRKRSRNFSRRRTAASKSCAPSLPTWTRSPRCAAAGASRSLTTTTASAAATCWNFSGSSRRAAPRWLQGCSRARRRCPKSAPAFPPRWKNCTKLFPQTSGVPEEMCCRNLNFIRGRRAPLTTSCRSSSTLWQTASPSAS